MVQVRAAVLGPTALTVGGREVQLPRAQRRLLAALVAAGRVASADLLVDALWGEAPPATARRSLHSHLSRLRAALGDDALSQGGDRYRLAECVALDLQEFEDTVARADGLGPAVAIPCLRSAIALWRGVPYVDLDGWLPAEQERHRIEERYRVAEEQLVHALLETVDAESAAVHARTLVDREPFRERRWEALMLALYRSGRQAEALTAFQDARRLLGNELGIDPGPRLRALEQAILAQDPALDGPAGPGPAGPASTAVTAALPADLDRLVARHPLHGRDAEAAVARAAWSAALVADQPALLVIEGEPGIGKTRLLADLAAAAVDDGATVRLARFADLGAAPPAGPLLTALALGPAAPGLGAPGAGTVRSTEDLLLTVDRLADEVASRLGGRGGALLAVEDLQGADAVTIRVLHRLVTVSRARGVLIATTVQSATTAPRSPDLEVLLNLRDDKATVTRLHLGALDPDSSRQIVDQWRRADTDDIAVDDIVDRSGGNPLHLVELARWTPSPGALVPTTIAELTRARLDGLDRASRDLVEAGAVLGDEFDLGTASTLADLTADAVLEAMGRASRSRLLDRTADGLARFGHRVTREAVLTTIAATRRAQLEWCAGEVLGRGLGVPSMAVARHLLDGVVVGDPVTAAQAAVAAARDARDELDPTTALQLLDQAERSLRSGGDDTIATVVDLHLARSALLARQGRVDEAKTAAADGATLAARTQDPVAIAASAIGYAELVNAGEADPTAPALLDAALRHLGPDQPGLSARILAALANYHAVVLADTPGAAEIADDAIDQARGHDDDVMAEALWARACALLGSPAVEQRLETAEELLTYTRPGDRRHVEGLRVAAHTHLELGDRAGAEAAVAALGRAGERQGSWDALLWSRLWHAQFALLEARLDDAERITSQITAELAGGSLYATMLAATQSCHHHLERGTLAAMLPLLEQVADSIDLGGTGAFLVQALLQHGANEEAERRLGDLVDRGRGGLRVDQTYTGALALLIDASLLLGRVDLAADLGARLAPYAGRFVIFVQGAVCFGSADHHLGQAAAARGDLAAADRHFRAAAAIEASVGARLALLHTRTEQARLAPAASRNQLTADLADLRAEVDGLGLVRLRERLDGLTAT